MKFQQYSLKVLHLGILSTDWEKDDKNHVENKHLTQELCCHLPLQVDVK